MPMSDEDFEKLLRKLGAEDSDPEVIERFREALAKYDSLEDIDLLNAKIMFFALGG
jgi:hypothetical protein